MTNTSDEPPLDNVKLYFDLDHRILDFISFLVSSTV